MDPQPFPAPSVSGYHISPLLVRKIVCSVFQAGDDTGELCPKGRLLGLFCARQNQVWCQRGWRPGILQDHIAPSLTVPQFFSLPSLLGSAGRTLSWYPPSKGDWGRILLLPSY